MRGIGIFLIILLTLGSVTPVYSMTTAKRWVNDIRPGTFEDPEKDAEDAARLAKEQERKFTEGEMKVLVQLRKREEELEKREEAFQKKAGELKLLSQQIEQKLDQMRILASEIEQQRKDRKQMDEKDISRMVKYYETMTSDNTAIFFNQMDRGTATHLLMRMNPRKASAVMQLLDPKVAVEITERVTRFKKNRDEVPPAR